MRNVIHDTQLGRDSYLIDRKKKIKQPISFLFPQRDCNFI